MSIKTAEQDGGTPLSLLEGMRANRPESWTRLLALYRPLVLFWCRRAGVSEVDAEDVAQEVFAAAAGDLAGFHRDRPGDTFRGWLRGITHYRILQHIRNNQGQPQAEGGSVAWNRLHTVADPLAEPADDEEEAQIGALYRRALEQVRCEFEPRTWEAFWRTAIEGRSPADLAAELGTTAANIRQAKARVLRRLREEIGDLLG